MIAELKHILLAEDNANDVELTLAALRENNIVNEIVVVRDGAQALDYLYKREAFVDRPGANPALVGKNLIDLKDQNGKFLIRELAATAKNPGAGWVDYKWPNPNTKLIEAKSSYVERIGDYFVGVGIYQQ